MQRVTIHPFGFLRFEIFLIALALSAVAAAQSARVAEPQYTTSHRIQVSDPCPQVAKWLVQMLTISPRWTLLRYDPEMGTLSFKITLGDTVAKEHLAEYSQRSKRVRIDGVLFTLRSLVSSSISFEGAPRSGGDSCTLAAAFQLIGRDGAAFSNGQMEEELLQMIQRRYAAHGLDY